MTDNQIVALLVVSYFIGPFINGAVRGANEWYQDNSDEVEQMKRALRLWWLFNRIRFRFKTGVLVFWGFGVIKVINLKTGKITHGKFTIGSNE